MSNDVYGDISPPPSSEPEPPFPQLWLRYVEDKDDTLPFPSADFRKMAEEIQRAQFYPDVVSLMVEKLLRRAERWERWEALLDPGNLGAPDVREVEREGWPDGEEG